MEIRTVAVMGAGAVGSYFIWGLHEKLGDRLWVVADGERKARLEQEGIVVNGSLIKPCVRTPEEARGADLLVVAVKYGALKTSLEEIAQVTDRHTVVMSVLNGVDSEEIVGERIGMEHMVYSVMKIASERRENQVVFDPAATLGVLFGEADRQKTERIQAIAALLEGSQVHYIVCEDIIREIWCKYMLNIGNNLPQAMVGCGFGAYDKSEYLDAIRRNLRKEVEEVARAKGIDLSDQSIPAARNSGFSLKARFSTLQDLDAGRHTEIDMFSGVIMRMGKELGIATPCNEFTYYMIKTLEEKNDGLLE